VCTLMGVVGPAGWVLASTSDDPYKVQNHLIGVKGDPLSYLAVQVITEPPIPDIPWNGMLTRAVNSAGLAYTYAYVHEPGNGNTSPQRWPEELLATCETVEHAIALFRRLLGTVLSGNYVLADARGNAVVVEVSRQQLHVGDVSSGFVACANMWGYLPQKPHEAYGASTAMDRVHRVRTLLSTSRDGLSCLLHTTRDHIDGGEDERRPYGVSICNHGREEGTISAEILVPTQGKLWWTYGWPCGSWRGYENPPRSPWGRYVAFDVYRIPESGELVTPDGRITPLGVRCTAAIEGSE
jgi:hypothetical protein